MFLFRHGPYLLICFVYVPIHSTDTGYSHMDHICLFIYVPIHSTDTGYSHMDRICLFVLFLFPSTLLTLVIPTWTVSAYLFWLCSHPLYRHWLLPHEPYLLVLFMFPPTLLTFVIPTWTVSVYFVCVFMFPPTLLTLVIPT